MQSQHAAVFNHDPWADGYDEDVRNEANPVRQAYGEVLAWTVAQAQIGAEHTVVDLGTGTGNTAQLIGPVVHLFCVDISAKMLALAREKLATRLNGGTLEFVQADLLGFFTGSAIMSTSEIRSNSTGALTRPIDRLVSTYAVHHLTEPEKAQLFGALWQALRPGGRAVFGDLMVTDAQAHAELVAHYRSLGDEETVEGLTEEFFWDLAQCRAVLTDIGFEIESVQQFSPLSWGIAIVKPAV